MFGYSVLHQLAMELYSIVYPAISTWRVVRDIMAANEAEWSFPLSDELSEGLSLPKKEPREVLSEATPSTSGARPSSKVDSVSLKVLIPINWLINPRIFM